jgi:hypothetical protein
VKLAATVPHLTLARRAVGVGDVAVHLGIRDAVETIVYDDIPLVEFHGANLQKNSATQALPELRNSKIINYPSYSQKAFHDDGR